MKPIAPRMLAVAGIVTLFSGCAINHTSMLDDSGPIQTSWQDHFKVDVVAVDGVPRAPGPLEISPGRHDVTFEARPYAGVPLPATRTIAMSIMPCTAYRMVARPDGAATQDWRVVIEDSNPMGFCADRGSNEGPSSANPPPVTSFRN